MGAPEEWQTSHDEAVYIIVGVGNDILDGLADKLEEICAVAAAEADSLRIQADEIEPIAPVEAEILRDEADQIEAAAVTTSYALAAAAAEEGSALLSGMCGNAGQEKIIDDALGDFQSICIECADDAVIELA